MKFSVLAPAQAEFLEAIAHYASIRADLGVRFEEAVAKAIRDALAHPQRGAPRSKRTRRWLVTGFPFGVIYQASETKLIVVAVAHQRKRPEYWNQRVE